MLTLRQRNAPSNSSGGTIAAHCMRIRHGTSAPGVRRGSSPTPIATPELRREVPALKNAGYFSPKAYVATPSISSSDSCLPMSWASRSSQRSADRASSVSMGCNPASTGFCAARKDSFGLIGGWHGNTWMAKRSLGLLGWSMGEPSLKPPCLPPFHPHRSWSTDNTRTNSVRVCVLITCLRNGVHMNFYIHSNIQTLNSCSFHHLPRQHELHSI